MRPGLRLEPLLALAINDAADPRPVDRARAHRAGFGRSIERAGSQEREVVGAGGARGEELLCVGGAVPALAGITVALLHEKLSLAVRQDRAERMVARFAGAPRDVECPAQQRLVVGAKGGDHVNSVWGRARIA
jgi:hypothetical protein